MIDVYPTLSHELRRHGQLGEYELRDGQQQTRDRGHGCGEGLVAIVGRVR